MDVATERTPIERESKWPSVLSPQFVRKSSYIKCQIENESGVDELLGHVFFDYLLLILAKFRQLNSNYWKFDIFICKVEYKLEKGF